MKLKETVKAISSGYKAHLSVNNIFLDEYYTKEKSERQKYDLVFPTNVKGKIGLVLCIHGGGWVQSSKDEYTKSLFKLSEEYSLAAACINYRYVSESVNFNDVCDDITSALKSIKETARKYGIDIDKVLFTGISAGGHLSLYYAYAKKDISPIKPVCVVELCGPADLENKFFYSDKNRVGASVGVEYFTNIIGNGIGYKIDLNNFDKAREKLKEYSPVNFVDENTVPTVFGHGEIDDIVPYQNSVDLDKKLNEFNIEHTFISIPGANHECDNKDYLSKIMKLFFECAEKYLK